MTEAVVASAARYNYRTPGAEYQEGKSAPAPGGAVVVGGRASARGSQRQIADVGKPASIDEERPAAAVVPEHDDRERGAASFSTRR
jgi:hypothetical protein